MQLLPDEIKFLVAEYLDVPSLWNVMLAGGYLFDSIRYNVTKINTGNGIVNSKLIISYPNIWEVIGRVGVLSSSDAYLLSQHPSLCSAYFIVSKEDTSLILEAYMSNVFIKENGRIGSLGKDKVLNRLYNKKFLFFIEGGYIFINEDKLVFYVGDNGYGSRGIYNVFEKLIDTGIYKNVYIWYIGNSSRIMYTTKYKNINTYIIISEGVQYYEIELILREWKDYKFVFNYDECNGKKHIDVSDITGCNLPTNVKSLAGPFVNMIDLYKEWKNKDIEHLGFYCDFQNIKDTIKSIKDNIFSINDKVTITLYTDINIGEDISHIGDHDRITIESDLQYMLCLGANNVFNA